MGKCLGFTDKMSVSLVRHTLCAVDDTLELWRGLYSTEPRLVRARNSEIKAFNHK